ncbi:MAG TPA: G1 family glutamic endopeptidase [Chloroflexota bacterium]
MSIPSSASKIRRAGFAAAGIALLVVGAACTSVLGQSQDPQTSAIENVIQQANAEQTQAISANDPSAMSDTATPAHYQQLVQINQELLSQGVTGIQLSSLSWGPIAVNGSTASAQTSETWTTTFSDGTTLQSTDTNDYSLQQQSGTWLIQDDQQPSNSTQAAGSPATQPPAPASSMPASVRDTSRNWSGYDASGGTYTGVTATWTVPQPTTSGATGVGATWVGIGGVNSRDLIQAGTQDVASSTGQSQYQAWIELLPQASRQVRLAVRPGDSVTVSIQEQGQGTGVWQISFTNNTSGQTYQTTVNYASTESSVEWVEEAPMGQNGLLPLDNFSSVAFSQASATVNGQTQNLSQLGAQPITMLNGSGQPLAVPSSIGSDGSSFLVTRTSAASTPAPAARAPSRGVAPGVAPVSVLP